MRKKLRIKGFSTKFAAEQEQIVWKLQNFSTIVVLERSSPDSLWYLVIALNNDADKKKEYISPGADRSADGDSNFM